MKDFSALVRGGIALVVFAAVAQVSVAPVESQSAVAQVVVTSVNANDEFPDVSLQVKVLDADGTFIPGIAASQFSLREDGKIIEIREVRTEAFPLNAHVIFVIDELGIARHITAVREAIQSFAENQMQPGDLVEVLAATKGGGISVIVPLTSDPNEVVNGIANYNPASASGTFLLEAVDQGLNDLAALSENTERLNRMVVFSISILDQLDLDETIDKAVKLKIPIHTVLLGTDDANGALGRLARETQANGNTISTNEVDKLFATLADQRVQDQYLISYRSKVNQAGEHELIVSVDDVSSNTVAFVLDELKPPFVRIIAPAPDSVITRTESSFNQNTENVQPTEQTVTVEVNWPDGHPREIVAANTALVVNGESLGPATAVRDNGKDPVILEFTWDLTQENIPGETTLSVVVEAQDELGLKGTSEPLSVIVKYLPFEGTNYPLILSLGSLVIVLSALLGIVMYRRRNPKVQAQVKERFGTTMMENMRGTRTSASHMSTQLVRLPESAKATLEVVEGKSGTSQTVFYINDTITLGRSKEHAQQVFQADHEGSPISRLHCTLLEKDGAFHLRDEFSANGTFLNGVRLKPGELHRLNHGDLIELAPVKAGGLKLKFQTVSRAGHMETQLAAPPSTDSGSLPKDGYTPTMIQKPGATSDDLPKDGYTPTRISQRKSQ